MSALPAGQPLKGIKVIEFTHMVMGPAVGAIMASLGADVTRVEPIGGDRTRRLKGAGAGYFAMYNRHKKSVCLNLKDPDGLAAAKALIAASDILVENYRPGAMDRLGLGYDALKEAHEGLIYCSEKGFLSGPYEDRTALDEVAQMMGGLAYMTGPPGQPLRAGASVIDVTGGMFGVIGVLAALQERNATGKGQKVQSALFETTIYMVGQHMAQMAVTGTPAPPMPARVSAWAIYDVFETKDDDKLFLGVVTDSLWKTFCDLFGLDELWADMSLRENNGRVDARPQLMPKIRAFLKGYTRQELVDKLDGSGLPFAPIGKPEEMFDDPHLNAGGGLEPVTLVDGTQTHLPSLPIEMNGVRPSAPSTLPQAGANTREALASAGLSDKIIDDLLSKAAAETP